METPAETLNPGLFLIEWEGRKMVEPRGIEPRTS